MKPGIETLRLIGICALTLLSGCAGTPHTDGNTGNAIAADELRDDSIDVLFATEFPVESAAEAIRRAELALKAGDTERALFFLVRALQFQPDNVPLLVQIGEIQMRRQQTGFAMRAFLMAQHHDPENSTAHEGLGLIYAALGRQEEAVEHLKKAVALSTGLWRAHNALGVSADQAGNYATAQHHYDLALAANPEAAHVLNNRGYSKYLAGDTEGAMRDFYEAANDRGFTKAWANLAKIHAEAGRYREAIKTYKLVMNEASAFNSTGYAAMNNGDFSLAERYLTEAIRLSPTYFPLAEENLVLLQEQQQRDADNATQADAG
jgi:Flp pilus assembly protein TadD